MTKYVLWSKQRFSYTHRPQVLMLEDCAIRDETPIEVLTMEQMEL